MAKSRKGTPHPDRTNLKRWFGDLPVVDATEPLRLQPNADDIKTAIKRDMKNCVLSRTCQRLFNSTCVVFFREIAYVDLLDKNGIRRVERFRNSRETKRYIDQFDEDMEVIPQGFTLYPPRKSERLDDQALQKRKERRAAALKGKKTGSNALRPKRKPTGHGVERFRDGRGMVQFPELTANS